MLTASGIAFLAASSLASLYHWLRYLKLKVKESAQLYSRYGQFMFSLNLSHHSYSSSSFCFSGYDTKHPTLPRGR